MVWGKEVDLCARWPPRILAPFPFFQTFSRPFPDSYTGALSLFLDQGWSNKTIRHNICQNFYPIGPEFPNEYLELLWKANKPRDPKLGKLAASFLNLLTPARMRKLRPNQHSFVLCKKAKHLNGHSALPVLSVHTFRVILTHTPGWLQVSRPYLSQHALWSSRTFLTFVFSWMV